MAKAPIGKRILAYIIDCVLGGVLIGIAIGIAAIVMILGLSSGKGAIAMVGMLVYFLALFGAIAIMILYLLCRDVLFKGRSLGKKLMSLKIVGKDGQQAGKKALILRNVTMLIPLLNIIELIMPFVDKDGLRFGDKIAGTQVLG